MRVLGTSSVLVVGDSKMGALATRGTMVAGGSCSLGAYRPPAASEELASWREQALAPHRLDASVHPRRIQRSVGQTPLETTLVSLHLTHKGQEDASERLNSLMHGLRPCPPCVSSAPPVRPSPWSVLPPSPPHPQRPAGPSNSAKAALTDTASLHARTVGNNPAAIIPGATGTLHRASSIQPRSGYRTTWTNRARGRTSSSPSLALRPCVPVSALLPASPPRPWSPPRLQPSNGSPKTRVSLAPTALACSGSCLPGADSSSTTPPSTPWSPALDCRRTDGVGDLPAPTALSLSQPSPPSPALVSTQTCPKPDCWRTSPHRPGLCLGPSPARPIQMGPHLATTSPPMSSGALSPLAASARSRSVASPSPLGNPAVHVYAPPPSTPWRVSAASSTMVSLTVS
jgi:hypothetical protein